MRGQKHKILAGVIFFATLCVVSWAVVDYNANPVARILFCLAVVMAWFITGLSLSFNYWRSYCNLALQESDIEHEKNSENLAKYIGQMVASMVLHGMYEIPQNEEHMDAFIEEINAAIDDEIADVRGYVEEQEEEEDLFELEESEIRPE